jgi:hypothetical protein
MNSLKVEKVSFINDKESARLGVCETKRSQLWKQGEKNIFCGQRLIPHQVM